MKKIIEVDEGEGLVSLLGQTVTVLCANYFYTGKLIGVNREDIILKNPKIVYETGPWDNREWADAQALPSTTLYVRTSFIEAYGVLK